MLQSNIYILLARAVRHISMHINTTVWWKSTSQNKTANISLSKYVTSYCRKFSLFSVVFIRINKSQSFPLHWEFFFVISFKTRYLKKNQNHMMQLNMTWGIKTLLPTKQFSLWCNVKIKLAIHTLYPFKKITFSTFIVALQLSVGNFLKHKDETLLWLYLCWYTLYMHVQWR